MKKLLLVVACLPLLAACGKNNVSVPTVSKSDKPSLVFQEIHEFHAGPLYLSAIASTKKEEPGATYGRIEIEFYGNQQYRGTKISPLELVPLIAALETMQKDIEAWRPNSDFNRKKDIYIVGEAEFSIGKDKNGVSLSVQINGVAANLSQQEMQQTIKELKDMARLFKQS